MNAFEITPDDIANVLHQMGNPIPLADALEIVSGHEGEIEKAALIADEDQTDAAYAKIREILEGALCE